MIASGSNRLQYFVANNITDNNYADNLFYLIFQKIEGKVNDDRSNAIFTCNEPWVKLTFPDTEEMMYFHQLIVLWNHRHRIVDVKMLGNILRVNCIFVIDIKCVSPNATFSLSQQIHLWATKPKKQEEFILSKSSDGMFSLSTVNSLFNIDFQNNTKIEYSTYINE